VYTCIFVYFFLRRDLRATRTGVNISDGMGFITEWEAETISAAHSPCHSGGPCFESRYSLQRFRVTMRTLLDGSISTSQNIWNTLSESSNKGSQTVHYAGRCRWSFNTLWKQTDVKATFSVCLITQHATNTHGGHCKTQKTKTITKTQCDLQ
jgi:hypothetical protein